MTAAEFKLRPWRFEDLDTLIKYANNFKIAKNMTDQFPHPYTIEKGKAFIDFASSSQPTNILAIESNNEVIGAIGIHPQNDIQRKNAELGYWLAEPFWGKGIMTNAIIQMTEYAFKNWDINRIFARPFGTNIGSQKALEKAGFKLEGRFEKSFYKNDEFVDELIYAIRKS
ncbi:MAG: GNAT family N-acetyltransferase [Bacteroidia bacterium]|nr:GNAT family N-acetyltransferase [Bacteroidia bacterium]